VANVTIVRISDGVYRVERDGQNDLMYVVGPPAERWVFWKGQVFHGDFRVAAGTSTPKDAIERDAAPLAVKGPAASAQLVVAPMPARVIKIPVQVGSSVKKGDTVVLLEAMKMELPVRAPSSGTVKTVHCHEGDLVQADAALLELATA
jgi:biotin carboxyl carrier protein